MTTCCQCSLMKYTAHHACNNKKHNCVFFITAGNVWNVCLSTGGTYLGEGVLTLDRGVPTTLDRGYLPLEGGGWGTYLGWFGQVIQRTVSLLQLPAIGLSCFHIFWLEIKIQISRSEEFHFGGSYAKNSSSILRPTDDESSMIWALSYGSSMVISPLHPQ